MNTNTAYTSITVLSIVSIFIITSYIIHLQYNNNELYSYQEGLTSFEKQLKCPFTILKNLNKCVAFYLTDILLYVIWGIIFILCYFIIYLPVLFANTIICLCIKDWFGGCFTIKPTDVCPSKKNIAFGFETAYNIFTGNNYFYRSKKDIDKCYCTKPIKKVFDPLDKFKSIYSEVSGNPMSIGASALILPLSIFAILYYFSNKNSSTTK